MNYAKLAVIFLVTLALSSCQTAPKITICNIINKDIADCRPGDKKKDRYDEEIKLMRGYFCVSPKDVGALKKYINSISQTVYTDFFENE